MRLIDADALMQKMKFYKDVSRNKYFYSAICQMMNLVNDMDCVIVEATLPVRHGRWIDVTKWVNATGSNGKDYRKCSECLHTQEITGLLNYCPVCGARMDVERRTE